MILALDGEAERVEIWGSGTPLREFLHVDDCADACLFLMEHYSGAEHVNVGSGEEISIAGLAGLIAEIVGFEGELAFDASRPDGTPRKLLDSGRLEALGWRHRIGLREGIAALVGPVRGQLLAEAVRSAVARQTAAGHRDRHAGTLIARTGLLRCRC